MSATKEQKIDSIFDEMTDLEFDIMTNIGYLIKAKWDAPTVKHETEKMNKHRINLWNEIDLLEEREKQKK